MFAHKVYSLTLESYSLIAESSIAVVLVAIQLMLLVGVRFAVIIVDNDQ